MPGSPETIAVRISRELADRIVSGVLEPGSRLRQDHVAAEFGTSHVPVREAFRRLEAQGLAVSEPRRGVRVASFDLAEVKEVAEMRAALEVLALRHAAPHLTRAILDAAEAATRAGYLVGALERGAAETGGIHAALVDRVESAATNGLEERPAAVREAYEAGRQAGLESG